MSDEFLYTRVGKISKEALLRTSPKGRQAMKCPHLEAPKEEWIAYARWQHRQIKELRQQLTDRTIAKGTLILAKEVIDRAVQEGSE